MKINILIICVLGTVLSSGVRAQVARFAMKMDWNPTSCSGGATPCREDPYEAFTVYELVPYTTRWVRLSECATATDVSSDISNETTNELECIFKNSAGSNSVLWTDVYNEAGSCSGVSTSEYFRLMTQFYNTYNPNVVFGKNGLSPPSVDKTAFQNQMTSAVGRQVLLECQGNSRNLQNVVVCLYAAPPYDPVDCPGQVNAPRECEIYIKSASGAGTTTTSPTPSSLPSSSPNPPSSPSPNSSPVPSPVNESGSSSNIGAIVGGVIGGIAVIALAVGGLVLINRKKREQELNIETPVSLNGTGPSNGASYTYMGVPGPDPSYATSPPNMYGSTAPNTLPQPAQVVYPPPISEEGNPVSYPLGGPMAVAVGGGLGGYGSNVSRASGVSGSSMPSTPASNFTTTNTINTQRALASDPLLQYINSTLSNTSGGSRGPLAAWQLRFEDITIERPIGEGSWGRVYKGNWNQTQVAIKILLDSTTGAEVSATQSALMASNSPIMARLEQEASIMTTLHHPNIVQFLGITIFPAAVVTEFCARGSLTSVLQGGNAAPDRAAELTWSRRIAMAADTVRGMLYLHTRNPPIIHRDLKSANLLVTTHWKVKVSDFNLSKIMEDSTRSTSLQAMNPRWLAPEVLNGGTATLAADMFAFGVILWELLTWQLPWGTANPWGIVGQVTTGNRLVIPPPGELPGPESGSWPQLGRYIELMNRCWAQEPSERPSFQEVMVALREIDPEATEIDS